MNYSCESFLDYSYEGEEALEGLLDRFKKLHIPSKKWKVFCSSNDMLNKCEQYILSNMNSLQNVDVSYMKNNNMPQLKQAYEILTSTGDNDSIVEIPVSKVLQIKKKATSNAKIAWKQFKDAGSLKESLDHFGEYIAIHIKFCDVILKYK